jgi:hypothetical protein
LSTAEYCADTLFATTGIDVDAACIGSCKKGGLGCVLETRDEDPAKGDGIGDGVGEGMLDGTPREGVGDKGRAGMWPCVEIYE